MDNNFKFKGKFIGFDFDGTLADSLALYLKIYNELAREKGYPIATLQDVEQIRTTMVSLTDLIKFAGNFGINLLQFPVLLKEMFFRIRSHQKELLIFPGIPELIADLYAQGYVLYMITSNRQEIIKQILKFKKLAKYFTGISALDFMGNKGKRLQELTRELRIKPQQFLYIGDEVRDIKAARKAGMPVISVTWGINTEQLLRKYKPDAVAGNLDELRDLLAVAYSSGPQNENSANLP